MAKKVYKVHQTYRSDKQKCRLFITNYGWRGEDNIYGVVECDYPNDSPFKNHFVLKGKTLGECRSYMRERFNGKK